MNAGTWRLKGRASVAASPEGEDARPDAVGTLPGWPSAVAQTWRMSFDHWAGADAPALTQAAAELRRQLRPHALGGVEGARALGLVAAALKHTLGWSAYDQQGLAAWLMLRGRLVEMATGEGKTLAAGLAAATAGLAGLSVHVLTANDYLVERDRETLEPLFRLLGLGTAAVCATTPRESRLLAYRQPIVYVTGRELVFDHLKDHLQLRGERDPRVLRARALGGEGASADGQALLPRLQQAIIDEADSILLDEASIPFILSTPGAAPDVAALEAARVLAGLLGPEDFVLMPSRRQAELTEAGRERVARTVPPSSPLWPARHAVELVRAALVAERLLVRDRDYTLSPGKGVQLIDEITGRIAFGRQWNSPLHAMVELKEGLEPTPAMQTAARITYQRFFPRYERLGGMSGTLRESHAELKALYGCPVVRVPLVKPSQARWWGQRGFVDAAARQWACVERIRDMVQQRRPVLVGTDSVRTSQNLSAALTRAGIEHQVLNAVQDADEAQAVARAGEAGRVTVTTNMAGRGTDIRLSEAALAAGGLHVILALSNRSRRIDRQLAGRAARHGDPGSAESLVCLDDPVIAQTLPARWRAALARRADAQGELPALLVRPLVMLAQRRAEWRERLLRRDLRLMDEGLVEQLAFSGRQE